MCFTSKGASADIWRRVSSLRSFSAKKGTWRVVLDRLSNGERIAGISAILLFVFMFFHWFGVKATNTSNLLFAIQSIAPGKTLGKRSSTSRSFS